MTKDEFLQFCRQNPKLIYQDIFIDGKVCLEGVNDCGVRFPILKGVLDLFERKPFTVLDVGAAQGYFSHRVAYEYPNCEVTMIEHKNKNYDHHGKLLYQLSKLNELKNVTYLHHELSVASLRQLNQLGEHFNVILLMLVVHQISDDMDIRKSFIEEAFKLGDVVFLELSNDWASELRDYVRDELSQSQEYECAFLGEVYRFHDHSRICGPYPAGGKGEFYLFKKKSLRIADLDNKNSGKISQDTFNTLNGVYPD